MIIEAREIKLKDGRTCVVRTPRREDGQVVLDYMLQHEHVFGFGDHRLYELTIRFCAGGLGNLYRDWFAGKLDLTLDQLTREAESMVCRIIESIQKGH